MTGRNQGMGAFGGWRRTVGPQFNLAQKDGE